MYILGFNCYAHDSAAAILRDGRLLGLVEEERFVRVKHTREFPEHAIRWCLQSTGIDGRDLDHIVFYWDPALARMQRAWHLLRYAPRSLGLIRSRIDKELPMSRLKSRLREQFGIDFARTQFHWAEHHLCHSASAFLTTSFDRAAILSIDAAGEWDCTWMGVGDGLDLRCCKRMQFPNSLGIVYGAFTEYLGFSFGSGEGKVMGLAPYGMAENTIDCAARGGDARRYIDLFREIIREEDEGGYRVDLSWFTYHYYGRPRWFSGELVRALGPPRAASGELTQHYMDVAAALQQRTEEIGIHMARWLRRSTGEKKLCMAGGVCLNACMNGRILEEAGFDEVSVHPAANDAGTALGGCFWLWNTVLRRPRTWTLDHAFLGPDLDEAECRVAARQALAGDSRLSMVAVDDAPAVAAQMLSEGKIIGWFQGRMELGPRALGNRSILADPRTAEMKDLLNARVKFREGFRPYAPSVLKERAAEWFDSDHPSPYMILVYRVRPEMRGVIPAVTHVDGSARVQTVDRETNPRYYRLIEQFEARTGVPVLLNTSFNVRGEPIVLRAADAIRCFARTGMDALFLGDLLLTKSAHSAAREMSDAEVAAGQAMAAAADSAVA